MGSCLALSGSGDLVLFVLGDIIQPTGSGVLLVSLCRRPLRIVPYIRTLVPYIRTFGAPD